jgi:acyl carrier protein phosphodiesterase
MNYLAHIFLSGDKDEVKIGNFIADFVPGKKHLDYPEYIQKGILLHRKIDAYTDSHPIFKVSKKRLFNDFRHYSAVIVDMFYDHFLAKNFSQYSDIPLEEFVASFYDIMMKNEPTLPDNVKRVLPVMVKYNWLLSYRELDKLQDILNQMNNRTHHNSNLHHSIKILKSDYKLFEDDFKIFFDDILEVKNEMHKSLKIH